MVRISPTNPGPSGPDENFLDHAVLHWFLDQRLLDPGAGRERGLTTQTNIHTRLEVETQCLTYSLIVKIEILSFDPFGGIPFIETIPRRVK